MSISRVSLRAAAVIVFIATHVVPVAEVLAQTQPVTVVIVRHPETGPATATEPPTFPLTPVGRQRAELLIQTFREMKFTHIFATHTIRARQTVEPVAAVHKLQIVQLPTPGSILEGQPVTDATSRQAAIEPIATAVLK